MILIFLACGTHDALDLPSSPPTAATELATMAVNIVTVTGTIDAIQPATRSFLISGDGKRTIVIVDEHATVVLNGNAGSVSDLVDGQVSTVEGEANGDLLIANHVVVGAAPEVTPDVAPGGAVLPTGAAPAATLAPAANPAPPVPPVAPVEPVAPSAPAP